MARIAIFALGLVVAVGGCESGSQGTPAPSGTSSPATAEQSNPAAIPSGEQQTTAVDNTAINARDRHLTTKTPLNQGDDSTDIKLTAEIRRRVMEQPKFSINAQNIKIISATGHVTLRGPVANKAEKDTIEKIANDVAGEANVNNEIEIVTAK